MKGTGSHRWMSRLSAAIVPPIVCLFQGMLQTVLSENLYFIFGSWHVLPPRRSAPEAQLLSCDLITVIHLFSFMQLLQCSNGHFGMCVCVCVFKHLPVCVFVLPPVGLLCVRVCVNSIVEASCVWVPRGALRCVSRGTG